MTQECGTTHPRGISRRDFHRISAAAGLVLAGCGSGRTAAADLPRAGQSAGRRQVALAGVPRGSGAADVGRALRRAVLGTTDLSWLSRGDTVFLKPVCNSGNVYPATTDPLALYEMITLLREHGAKRVIVGDMSGVQFVRFSPDRLTGSSRALMTGNGLLAAAEAAGAEVHAFEEAGWDGFFDETPVHGSNWKQPLLLPKVLKEVDHIVLMPRCSRHLLAGSTLGLKAAVGWWRHDTRLEYHHDARTFAEKTAESNTTPTLLEKQRLVVTCATKLQTTFGPDQGFMHEPETGLVLASDSIVAHDMVSLAWLNEGRKATPDSEKDSVVDDPNRSPWAVSTVNRVVNHFLGGVSKAISADALDPWSIDSVWQDRVLNRAFDVFDGVPEVDLVDANDGVPDGVLAALQAATRFRG